MKYAVYWVEDAEKDLLDIYRYVALNDSPEKAEKLLGHLEQTILKLEALPERGHYPPELERIGVREYREVFLKPYRIVYQIMESEMFIHCVLDGRRDLQELLQNRFLR